MYDGDIFLITFVFPIIFWPITTLFLIVTLGARGSEVLDILIISFTILAVYLTIYLVMLRRSNKKMENKFMERRENRYE